MEEPQKPKKSWISYWIIALCVFLLLQAFVFPNLFKGRVKEVGYETFISMTENNEIGSVTIESNQITFSLLSVKVIWLLSMRSVQLPSKATRSPLRIRAKSRCIRPDGWTTRI